MKTPKTQVWQQMVGAGGVPVMTMVCSVPKCRRYLGTVFIIKGAEYVYSEFAYSDQDRPANTHHMVKGAATEATGTMLDRTATTITQCPRCGDGHERNEVLLTEMKKGTKVLPIRPDAVRPA